MTRVAICFAVFLLLVAASVGASNVTNIELKKAGGFTTARIDIDGKIRFTHQTEEAKDGRPFRVIVDILSATHELGAKEFSVLPNCLIEGIRTSQFSVKPEQVVRIVFDMKFSPIYRVEPDNNSISVFFTDQSGPDFGPWSSAEFVKKTQKKASVKKLPESTLPTIALSGKGESKSAASQNKAIASDRLASLESAPKPAPKIASKPEISRASVQRASKVKVPPKPEIDAKSAALKDPPAAKSKPTAQSKPKSTVDSKKTAVSKQVHAGQVHSKWTAGPTSSTVVKKKSVSATPTPKVAKKTDIKPSAKVAAGSTVKVGTGPLQGPPPPPVTEPKVAAKNTKAESTASAGKAQPTPKKQTLTKTVAHQESKQPAAKKVAAKKTQSTATKKIAKAPKGKKAKVASIAKDSKPVSNEKSTSRFRRKPVVSKKIRGTLVAEFPKRLTIKYRARSSHDPFETLINENRRYNEPIGKQVPNLDGLRLVGVIESENGKNSALFEDKDGYGYILQSGDKVRKGYVLRVENDRVYFQIFEYGWSRTMALRMEEY